MFIAQCGFHITPWTASKSGKGIDTETVKIVFVIIVGEHSDVTADDNKL